MRRAVTIITMAIVCLMSCVPALAGGLTASVLGDANLDTVKGRVGWQFSPQWEAGGVAAWYVQDETGDTSGRDWGGGVYAKYVVDPNVVIPVAGWLPKVGSWLKLPETLQATTYLLGEALAVPYDDGVDLVGCVGAGLQVGIGVIEYTYGIVESGDADEPVLSSGSTMWLALCVEF